MRASGLGGAREEDQPAGSPPATPVSHRAVIYLNIQVVKGQRKVICLLKEQISNVSAPRAASALGGSPHAPPLLLGAPWGDAALWARGPA